MSFIPFTRSLGYQPGVQLNRAIDNSERFYGGNASQVIGTVGRFTRGRIDKAFRVNSGNQQRMLGQSVSPIVNRLNETQVHMYEAFRNGAAEFVVSRLVVAAAVNNSMFVEAEAAADDCLSTASSAPSGTLVTIKHLECFNEGIQLEVHATRVQIEDLAATATSNVALTGSTPLTVGGVTLADGDRVRLTNQSTPAQNGVYTVGIDDGTYALTAADDLVDTDSTEFSFRLRDTVSGLVIHEFTGSLDPTAVDDSNVSTYLPNVVSNATDLVEVTVEEDAVIPPTAAFYGVDGDGDEKWVTAHLVPFTEGNSSYASTDVDRALTALKYSEHAFGSLTTGASRSPLIISKMIDLGDDINKPVGIDVPGDLSVQAAIAFVQQLNKDNFCAHFYYAPIRAVDPLNGGKDILGVTGIQFGLRCRRDAVTDANGVPPKNVAVAGIDFPISRTGMEQVIVVTEQDRSDLAKARINPALFERYTNTSSYVFTDAITGAKKESDRKLIPVSEMSMQIDDWMAAFGKECLLRPMQEAIKRMNRFAKELFDGVETAKWLVPSDDLDGRSWVFECKPNAQRPKDRLDVSYWLSFDGMTRAIHIQQTISR